METGIQPPSNFWASKIATVREVQRAAEEADEAAWAEVAGEIGVVAMKRQRAIQQAQEAREAKRVEAALLGQPIPEVETDNVELCPECGSLVWSSGTESQGFAERGVTGMVQRQGRDPRQLTRQWKRCSNIGGCNWPVPQQSGSGAYSAGGRYF